jgi:hypothetical protein
MTEPQPSTDRPGTAAEEAGIVDQQAAAVDAIAEHDDTGTASGTATGTPTGEATDEGAEPAAGGSPS